MQVECADTNSCDRTRISSQQTQLLKMDFATGVTWLKIVIYINQYDEVGGIAL